jgi:hypothetical protein
VLRTWIGGPFPSISARDDRVPHRVLASYRRRAPADDASAAAKAQRRVQRLSRPVRARPMLFINRPASLNGALRISVTLTVAPRDSRTILRPPPLLTREHHRRPSPTRRPASCSTVELVRLSARTGSP